MKFLRPLGDWLGKHYDRLLAVLALAALVGAIIGAVIGLSQQAGAQRKFSAERSGMRPDHPEAALADLSPYEQAQAALETPPQFSAWPNTLFVPETRCYCIDCRRPIPMDAMSCPFCSKPQPPIVVGTKDRDFDSDGMPDVWEKQHGLDYRNKADAAQDSDGDGYSNLEEYKADPKTDPKQASDHPPYASKVVISAIEAEPFRLLFKAVLTLPGDVKQFQINTRARNPQTYFVKLGEPVGKEGFVVHSFEEKIEERIQGGVKIPVNVSILTLQNEAKKMIPLVYGQPQSYKEYRAKLRFLPDNLEFPARLVEPLDLRGESYRVITVDIPKETVVLQRLSDERLFEVHTPAQRIGNGSTAIGN